ncbi:unnamed protein product, partial [Owenia fusiformis]
VHVCTCKIILCLSPKVSKKVLTFFKADAHRGHFNHIHPRKVNIIMNLEIPQSQLESLKTVYEYTCAEHFEKKLNYRIKTKPSLDYYRHNCNSQYKDVALLIVFNTAHYEVIPLLENMYRPSFPKILYCGPEEIPQNILKWFNISFISYGKSTEHHPDGAANYECLTMAFSLRLNVTGYIFLGDDVMFYFWNLNFPKNDIWSSPQSIGDLSRRITKECTYNRGLKDWFCPVAKWPWWADYRFEILEALGSLKDLSKVSPVVQECLGNLIYRNGAHNRVNRGYADIYFVPIRYANEFIELSTIFWQHRVWLEIAVPTILNCIADRRPHVLPGKSIDDYSELRNQPWVHYPDHMDKVFFHPAKLGPVIDQSQDHMYYFCDIVMPEIIKNTKENCI